MMIEIKASYCEITFIQGQDNLGTVCVCVWMCHVSVWTCVRSVYDAVL